MSQRVRSPRRVKDHYLQVVVEIDEDGKYVASCPALQACYTQGDTYEEVLRNIEDVIALCLKEARKARNLVDLRYPEVIGTKQIRVAL